MLLDEGLHAWMTPQDTARWLLIGPIDLFGMKDVQDQGHTWNHHLIAMLWCRLRTQKYFNSRTKTENNPPIKLKQYTQIVSIKRSRPQQLWLSETPVDSIKIAPWMIWIGTPRLNIRLQGGCNHHGAIEVPCTEQQQTSDGKNEHMRNSWETPLYKGNKITPPMETQRAKTNDRNPTGLKMSMDELSNRISNGQAR